MWRFIGIMLVVLIALLLLGCNTTPLPVTGSPTPSLTSVPGLATTTATATITGVATSTVTSTPTMEPTSTPMTIATCVPQLTGDAILSCWLDQDRNGLRDPGETGISCTVLISYTGLLPGPLAGYQEIGSNSDGIWGGTLIPGTWTARLQNYTQDLGYVPYVDNSEWWNITVGYNSVLAVRFWSLSTLATPTTLVTPTSTPAPLHQCVAYWNNCLPNGQGGGPGRIVDPFGICGSGFTCWKVTSPSINAQLAPTIPGVKIDLQDECSPPYPSVSLRCCSEEGDRCRPLKCCGNLERP
jgi:hypothetical protein